MGQVEPLTQADIDLLCAWIKSYLPRFAICYKDESPFQKLLGWLLWPINRVYMTRYTTVMFGRVYFPSRAVVASWGPTHVYRILRHELVHLLDAKRFPLWFECSYLLLLPVGWTMRAYWEMRGYTQDLLTEYELTGQISDRLCEFIVERFVGSDYAWMWASKASVRRWLQRIRTQILHGSISGPYPYCDWGRDVACYANPNLAHCEALDLRR